MRRTFSFCFVLCFTLSTQLSCSSNPTGGSGPEPEPARGVTGATLEETLSAAGFTSVVETTQTGSVTTRVLITEDQTSAAIIVSDADSSVIFGIDENMPEVLFQLLAPDGSVIASLFDDKVVLANEVEIDLTEGGRPLAKTSDCDQAKSGLWKQLLDCAGFSLAGIGCSLATGGVGTLACVAASAAGCLDAAQKAIAAAVDCECRPELAFVTDAICLSADTQTLTFDYEAIVSVDLLSDIRFQCDTLVFGPGGPSKLVKARSSVSGSPASDWRASGWEFTPGANSVTIEQQYSASSNSGSFDLNLTFTPAFAGSSISKKLPVDVFACIDPANFEPSKCNTGLPACACPAAQQVIPLGDNMFGCRCDFEPCNEEMPPGSADGGGGVIFPF